MDEQLKPGRELDQSVARHLNYGDEAGPYHVYWAPNYSTKIKIAMLLVMKSVEEGYTTSIYFDHKIKEWRVCLGGTGHAHAEGMAYAISLAFLNWKALKTPVPEKYVRILHKEIVPNACPT